MNLLLINVVLFVAMNLMPGGMEHGGLGEQLALKLSIYFPASPFFHFWQPLTHMFVHATWGHLFSNMFALWMFGRIIEYDLGSKKFLIYYFVCGLGAALLQMGVNWMEISSFISGGEGQRAISAINTPMMGASGAVFGILLAFGLMHANSVIMLLIPPIPMKAKWFVIIYGLIELFTGVYGRADGIAHFAHLGGMLWGFLLLVYWKRKGKIYY